jgi:hypothetical protein
MKLFRRKTISCTIFLSIIASGCGPGQLFGSTLTPVPTHTPTSTQTPTSTATPKPSPTATLIPDWKGMIPIMPGATNSQDMGDSQFTDSMGATFTTGDISYEIASSKNEITAFYKQRLTNLGWKMDEEMMASTSSDLIMTKWPAFLFFAISCQGNSCEVMMHLVQGPPE